MRAVAGEPAQQEPPPPQSRRSSPLCGRLSCCARPRCSKKISSPLALIPPSQPYFTPAPFRKPRNGLSLAHITPPSNPCSWCHVCQRTFCLPVLPVHTVPVCAISLLAGALPWAGLHTLVTLTPSILRACKQAS